MEAVINRKRYRTATATLLASDAFWDGHNFERQGRNAFLFRTPNGSYFAQYQSQWEGERDRIEPLDLDAAIGLFEQLPEKVVEFEDAFPGATVEEA
jgi:hypothetical protein